MSLVEKIQKIQKFVLRDVWDMPQQEEERFGILGRIVRIGHLVFKGFNEDDLTIHASSLTFVFLTSLVPALAVAFAIMKGFGVGAERLAELSHADWIDQMPEAIQSFVDQVLNIVNSTNMSTLGFTGVIVFLFTVIMLLASIEKSFNRVWGVDKSRSILRQVTNYTSVLVLIPILIIGAVALRAHLAFSSSIPGVDVSILNICLQQSVSFFLVWAAFYFLYVLVPNVNVRMRPALISSFVFTLIFWGWQKLYALLQFGVARYNAIYGVFAAVPVTFAWLYASWVIILLGAEFTFAMQNSETFRLEGGSDTASMRARLLIALLVMRSAGQTMLSGKSVFDSASFARTNKVPIRLVNSVVAVLVKAGYLARVAERDTAYVLLRTADSIQVGDIVKFLMQSGSRPDVADTLKLDDDIKFVLSQVESGFERACKTTSLHDLIIGGVSKGNA